MNRVAAFRSTPYVTKYGDKTAHDIPQVESRAMTMRTRFAPSPTGHLHIGHAYAALAVEAEAKRLGARVTLRIEDIDATRCKPEFTEAMLDDLRWLGFHWDNLVVQSDRLDRYAEVIAQLAAEGLAYRCFCTRKEVQAAATKMGPEGPIYPGTCRDLDPEKATARAETEPFGWRLNHHAAMDRVGPLTWRDFSGAEYQAQPELLGDILLASRDRPASYHLAVVVDDADGHISHIVRGQDLWLATHVHRLLQAALDLPEPVYHHHVLLIDETGRKLSKSHGSLTLQALRQGGMSAEQLRDDLTNHRFPAGIRLQSA
ncbi:tRNA glutamyl-Q(34) synthetase GluQRS [Alterisphingorhabdus coralli]|uniref:tRNA glutamyl-Q(34) synthetase GluQRS n=1 Tax=Alterisphingorhabdus coralli TaxID=3071408 RepID=A0AA97I0L8_9SPHN|nr:tRNA glutamyl-Q(34) synthetase GluQRS [Parasphingorhabdus sp. SCSIO 66989]WOE75814.1 tRNA glutamyl-Q(34) synthetase GluQRS [Parasphingorhabdus sp. SCSIO 66989]